MGLALIQALIMAILAAIEALRVILNTADSPRIDAVRAVFIVLGLVVALLVFILVSSQPIAGGGGTLCGVLVACYTPTP